MRNDNNGLRELEVIAIIFTCVFTALSVPFISKIVESYLLKTPTLKITEPTSVVKAILAAEATPDSLLPPTLIPTAFVNPTVDPKCDFSMGEFREFMPINSTKTYTRCPVGEVEYSIQIDDAIEAFKLQCPGEESRDIKYWIDKEKSQGQDLNTYTSENFRSYQGCKVLITVITNNGDKIGYTVWGEVVGP